MKLILNKKLDEARETKSFFFTPDQKVTWQAGQYFYVTLPKLNYPDPRGDTRHFTISASPTEGDDIRITTRVRPESGFKKSLDELPIGTQLVGRGPNGLFVLPEKIKPESRYVFLAGGIGITPFRSMIKYALDKNIEVPIHVIHSNSDTEFVFKKDLDTWAGQLKNLKLNYIDTSKEGRLDLDKLKERTKDYDLTKTTFWVVGPPAYVNAMDEILTQMGVLEDNKRVEKFTGY